eukprot:scaffold12617_cov138-Skeletonema_marinoi.AAC.2
MSALGKCSFYVHTKDTQRYTTTLTSRGSLLHLGCACLFVRMFRDFGRILLLPRGWERGIAMPICGQPFFAAAICNSNRDSWRGSCAGVVEMLAFVGSLGHTPSSEVRRISDV